MIGYLLPLAVLQVFFATECVRLVELLQQKQYVAEIFD